jgi:hypothetical protein
MIERWIPVVAAVLGVAGGMGGAFVGGSVANTGQQQRFDNEQATRALDLRHATYVKYLEELEYYFFVGNTIERERAAEAAVLLVSPPALREAAVKAADAANGDDESAYTRARDRFIDLAQKDLTASG